MPSIALYQFIKVTKLMHTSKMAKNRTFRKKKKKKKKKYQMTCERQN